jgi:4-amino-4-deoxy-L-arabinose transferase-like glycosyltransferase
MSIDLRRHALPLAALGWLALMIAVIAARPPTPVDETRYLAVAWEMYQSGDWLSLRLNGALYGHKPPLLFWLINLGWGIFGVNVWWPRLLSGLFGLGALWLLDRLARILAPGRDDLRAMALLVTASSLYWMVFTGAVMFDLVLSFFVLLGAFGIARAGSGAGIRAWLLTGAALGLGILTKGPVAALHLLPLALLGPWWLRAAESAASPRRWGPWYAGVGVAVLVGAAIALAWAIPTALAGGGEFGREIFWSQSVDRMVSTDHHLRPFWFYVAMAPVLVLPWLFLPTVWRGFAALAGSGRSLTVRFAAAWLAPVAMGFSLFKGKQIQYLLPEVPAFALLAAAGLSALKTEPKRWEPLAVAMVFAALAVTLVWLSFQPRLAHLVQPADRPWVWLSAAVLAAVAAAVAVAPLRDRVATVTTIAAAGVAVVVGGYAGVGRAVFDGYDIAPVARHLAQAQQQGRPIAHFAKYHGQFHFVGRLTQPIEVIATAPELLAWAQRNPDGVVIVYAREPLTHADGRPPQFRQKFKGRNVYVWRGADLAGVSANWHRVENDGDGS